MFTQNISFKNFLTKKKILITKKNLNLILNEKNQLIGSLSKSYKDSFSKKNTKHFNKKFDYRIIGMGGSTLGAQAIYDFLKKKIKKKFTFVDNLNAFENKKLKKNFNNLIIIIKNIRLHTIFYTFLHLHFHHRRCHLDLIHYILETRYLLLPILIFI